MDLQLDCKKVEISPNTDSWITASIDGADKQEILNQLNLADIVEHFGISDILHYIGQDEVQSYFDLVPSEEG